MRRGTNVLIVEVFYVDHAFDNTYTQVYVSLKESLIFPVKHKQSTSTVIKLVI